MIRFDVEMMFEKLGAALCLLLVLSTDQASTSNQLNTLTNGDTDGETPRDNTETRDRRQAGYFDREEEEGEDVEKRAAGGEEQAGYFLSDDNNDQVWFSSRRKRQIAYFDREELVKQDNGLKKGNDNSEVVPNLWGQRRTRRQAGYFDKEDEPHNSGSKVGMLKGFDRLLDD